MRVSVFANLSLLWIAVLMKGLSAIGRPPLYPPPYPMIIKPPVYSPPPSPPPPPVYPAAIGYARFFGPLLAGCSAFVTTAPTKLINTTSSNTVSVPAQTKWGTLYIPAASGTYGGGMYGSSIGCTDIILGLPIPFSILAQFPSIASSSMDSSTKGFGISTTTTLTEGTKPDIMKLPAVSLYSIMVGTVNVAPIVNTGVFPLVRGGTLAAAQQTLVADVSSATVLMVVASFLKKAVPGLCTPASGGTASLTLSSIMDYQVTATAQSILSFAQLFNQSAQSPLQASTTFDATNSGDVFMIISASLTAAGCPPNLMKTFPAFEASASAVAQAVATIATAAVSQSKALSQLPIQMVLALARLVYSVQIDILPFFSDTYSIEMYATYLGPLINNQSILTGWLQTAQISTSGTLAAMGIPGGNAGAITVKAAAYGAGPLQSCSVVYYGLLTMGSEVSTTENITGLFNMKNVLTGLYSVPSGCSDYLLLIKNRISYTAALPPGLTIPAFIGSGAALSTAVYFTTQASNPSLPTVAMYNTIYNNIIGIETGFSFLTQSGGSVQWSASAIQVAAFAIDGLISSMVVSGSVFVAGAVPGMVPAGSGSSSGTLLTDTYADMMIHLLTGDLSIGPYINQTQIQALIFALYSEAMDISIPSNRTSTGGRRRILGNQVLSHHSRSLESILPDSQVFSLIEPLAQAIFNTNFLMYNRVLLPATVCITNADPAGFSMNVSDVLLLAAKITKIQNGLIADAAASLGAAVGEGNFALAQSVGQQMQTNFSGNPLNLAIATSVVNTGALPAYCTGAWSSSPACLGLYPSPPAPPGGGGGGGSSSSQLALPLGLGLGLGLPLILMGVAAGVLMMRRRRKTVVTPMPLNKGMAQQAAFDQQQGMKSPPQLLTPTGQPPMSPGGSNYPPLGTSASDWGASPRPWAFGLPAEASEIRGVLAAPPQSSGIMQRSQAQMMMAASAEFYGQQQASSPRPPWAFTSSPGINRMGSLPPLPDSPTRSRLMMSLPPPTPGARSLLGHSPLGNGNNGALSRTLPSASRSASTLNRTFPSSSSPLGPYGTPVQPEDMASTPSSMKVMPATTGFNPPPEGGSVLPMTPTLAQSRMMPPPPSPLGRTTRGGVGGVMTADSDGEQPHLAAAYGPPKSALSIDVPESPNGSANGAFIK